MQRPFETENVIEELSFNRYVVKSDFFTLQANRFHVTGLGIKSCDHVTGQGIKSCDHVTGHGIQKTVIM
jgi:hypothetical protein